MEHYVINGGKPLNGVVSISGAKNAALAIIPAAILAKGVSTIENLPDIADIKNLFAILEELGAVCEFKNKNTLIIDSTNINSHVATHKMVKKIRASYYLLGALLSRFKKAEVDMPGGCNFGSRPMDLHMKGFEALGATVDTSHGRVRLSADKLIGKTVYFDIVSVGATINLMIAATLAEGTTTIDNAAREPHVVDTANFLNMMGANIKGAGTNVIRIEGVTELKGVNYTIIPDQIEAGTYMIAAAITGGDITVQNIIPKHMDPLTAKLTEMNCDVEEGDDFIRVRADKPLTAVNVKTAEYPGFPTDLHPQMTALLTIAQGKGVITEAVWENRFQYVQELKRLGCQISVNGRIASTEGSSILTGAEVSATDLRAGAALVLAGLASQGTTKVCCANHINRGYENLEEKLNALGADVSRVKE